MHDRSESRVYVYAGVCVCAGVYLVIPFVPSLSRFCHTFLHEICFHHLWYHHLSAGGFSFLADLSEDPLHDAHTFSS